MLKQQPPKKMPVKFPPIAIKAGDSNGFEPNRRALSSAKNSQSRATDLEKQLFSKLEDYDADLRKQKRLERIDNRRKTKQSEPAPAKRQGKRSSTSHIEKSLKEVDIGAQLPQEPLSHMSKTSTEIGSTPLISNKENHTFITNARMEGEQPTEEDMRKYGQIQLQEECPFTEDEMERLYKEYAKEDCYIQYTSSKEIKQLNRILNHCDESLEDLTKQTQRMMKEIGYSMMDEQEPEVASEKPSQPND